MNILKKLFNFKKEKRIFVSRGEGMILSFSKEDRDESCMLHNSETGEEVLILDKEGYAVFANEDDFLKTDPHLIKYKNVILRRLPQYGNPIINEFRNGTALVSWTLSPDGRYFEDEDGFGGTNEEEENMYAYIDRHGKIIISFQWMPSYMEAEKILRLKAEAYEVKK